MAEISYIDPRTGATYPLSEPRWCSDSKAPLMLTELPGMGRSQIRQIRSLWRYADALPFVPEAPISLGEGCTPLIPHRVAGVQVFLKCEWFMPMGSFKDRGASVMLSLLCAQGVTSVLEDSSGNGGAAIAAYAAAGGMKAKILVPGGTSPAKLVQSRVCGAEVELVPGNRQACADEAVRQSDRHFYASHNWHPFFLQGTKTVAYELWEDFGFEAPDNVIMPCGAGSNVLGCAIGFGELMRAGEIDRLPRLFAVQPANCAPIARAYLGLDPVAALPSLAEGTAIEKPLRSEEVAGAVRASGGAMAMVSEDEIAQMTLALARGGIVAEPTSAQAAAGFARLLRDGVIQAGERTVVILTGTGLKTPQQLAQLLDAQS